MILDYDAVVTAFAHDIDLFPSSTGASNVDEQLPRLQNVSFEDRAMILDELFQTVLSREPSDSSLSLTGLTAKTNWQAIADMIVTRYSDFLYDIAHYNPPAKKSDLDLQLLYLLRPFIDADDRDIKKEVDRCTMHFIPPHHSNSTVAQAFIRVSHTICATLYSALEISSNDAGLDHALEALQNLMSYLQWTTWKECRPGCMYNEVCVTAIWPFGDKIDHDHPSCKNGTGMLGRGNYWDGFGLGPPGKGDKDGQHGGHPGEGDEDDKHDGPPPIF